MSTWNPVTYACLKLMLKNVGLILKLLSRTKLLFLEPPRCCSAEFLLVPVTDSNLGPRGRQATKKLATPHPRLALPHPTCLKTQPPAGVYFLTSKSSSSSDWGL
jgi:hypothetical protein